MTDESQNIRLAMLESYVRELNTYLCDGCRAIAVGLLEVRSGTVAPDAQGCEEIPEAAKRQFEQEQREEMKDAL